MRFPLWLKIIGVLVLLSLAATVLQAISGELLIPVVILVLLVIFPGKNLDRPRLIRVLPWYWALEFLAGVFLLAADYAGKQVLPPDARQPSRLELLAAVLSSTVLLGVYFARPKLFKKVLAVTVAALLTISIYVFLDSDRSGRDAAELAATIFIDVAILAYVLRRYKPGFL